MATKQDDGRPIVDSPPEPGDAPATKPNGRMNGGRTMKLDGATVFSLGLVIVLVGLGVSWGVQHQQVATLACDIDSVRQESQRKDVADERYIILTRRMDEVNDTVNRIAEKVGAKP